MHKERIKLTDTMNDTVVKMSDGNPGAMATIMELMTADVNIDPESILGNLGPILSLDSYGIYGTDIYILYNDHCGRNAHKLIVLLRATQMGIFPDTELKALASDQMRTNTISDETWGTIILKLHEQLPSLNTNFDGE